MAIKLDGVLAPVKDGKVENANKPDSKSEPNNKMGYDQFLQLLCAEMQYQDPLEPTSNTDYVAQMATFSQLESSLAMKDAMLASSQTTELSMANGLVGKTVIVKDLKSPTGYTNGTVDYVMKKDDKLMMSVNDTLYPVEDLDTVANDEYYEAVVTGKTIANMIAQLPKTEDLTTSYESAIKQIRELYDGLSDYQKAFISEEDVSKLERYERLVNYLIEKEKTQNEEAAVEEDLAKESKEESIE